MLREFRIEQQRYLCRRLAHALGDLLFQFRIKRDGAERAVVRLERFDQLCAERSAGIFGKLVGILGDARVVADFF